MQGIIKESSPTDEMTPVSYIITNQECFDSIPYMSTTPQ